MRKELVELVERGIMLYVLKQEGEKYTGDHTFNLNYIQKSRFISNDRKNNILKIADIIQNGESKNDSTAQLAADLFNHLKTIKTGFRIFFFEFTRINTGKSVIKEKILDSIYSYDPKLLVACKRNATDTYVSKDEDGVSQQTIISQLVQGYTTVFDDETIKEYTKLKERNQELEKENAELKTKLATAEAKATRLEKELTTTTLLIQQLTAKVDQLAAKLDSKPKSSEIQMTRLGVNKEQKEESHLMSRTIFVN